MIQKRTYLVAAALLLAGWGCGQKNEANVNLSDVDGQEAYNEQAAASISIANQTLMEGTVTIPKIILSNDGWIVIHIDNSGVPGEIIGQTAVAAGTHNDVKVTVNADKVTPVLHAMVHVDAGNKGKFEFPGADVPVTANSVAVTGSFQVTKPAASATTTTKVEVETKPAGTDVKIGTAVKVEAKPTIKSFTLTAKNWEFSPSAIKVKKGDTVKLTVVSTDVAHGFSLPDFNVNKQFKAGETVTAEFVADKTGTFTFRCSVFCGAGHKDMKGTLIVE